MKTSLLLPILYYFTFSPNVVQSQSKFLEKQKQTQNEKIEKWIEMTTLDIESNGKIISVKNISDASLNIVRSMISLVYEDLETPEQFAFRQIHFDHEYDYKMFVDDLNRDNDGLYYFFEVEGESVSLANVEKSIYDDDFEMIDWVLEGLNGSYWESENLENALVREGVDLPSIEDDPVAFIPDLPLPSYEYSSEDKDDQYFESVEIDSSGNGIFGRKVIYRDPSIVNVSLKEGRIVFQVCINRSGKVVLVEIVEDRSTLKDEKILKRGLNVLGKYKWESDYTAPKEQCGHYTLNVTKGY